MKSFAHLGQAFHHLLGFPQSKTGDDSHFLDHLRSNDKRKREAEERAILNQHTNERGVVDACATSCGRCKGPTASLDDANM